MIEMRQDRQKRAKLFKAAQETTIFYHKAPSELQHMIREYLCGNIWIEAQQNLNHYSYSEYEQSKSRMLLLTLYSKLFSLEHCFDIKSISFLTQKSVYDLEMEYDLLILRNLKEVVFTIDDIILGALISCIPEIIHHYNPKEYCDIIKYIFELIFESLTYSNSQIGCCDLLWDCIATELNRKDDQESEKQLLGAFISAGLMKYAVNPPSYFPKKS
jgi:hypothetical protein